MTGSRSIEAHLRTLERLLEEAAWQQAKARRDDLARLAQRAVDDIHSEIQGSNTPGYTKTHSKGLEYVGYLKKCLEANGDPKANKAPKYSALMSLKSYTGYLYETGAISEPFKFR